MEAKAVRGQPQARVCHPGSPVALCGRAHHPAHVLQKLLLLLRSMGGRWKGDSRDGRLQARCGKIQAGRQWAAAGAKVPAEAKSMRGPWPACEGVTPAAMRRAAASSARSTAILSTGCSEPGGWGRAGVRGEAVRATRPTTLGGAGGSSRGWQEPAPLDTLQLVHGTEAVQQACDACPPSLPRSLSATSSISAGSSSTGTSAAPPSRVWSAACTSACILTSSSRPWMRCRPGRVGELGRLCARAAVAVRTVQIGPGPGCWQQTDWCSAKRSICPKP